MPHGTKVHHIFLTLVDKPLYDSRYYCHMNKLDTICGNPIARQVYQDPNFYRGSFQSNF